MCEPCSYGVVIQAEEIQWKAGVHEVSAATQDLGSGGASIGEFPGLSIYSIHDSGLYNEQDARPQGAGVTWSSGRTAKTPNDGYAKNAALSR